MNCLCPTVSCPADVTLVNISCKSQDLKPWHLFHVSGGFICFVFLTRWICSKCLPQCYLCLPFLWSCPISFWPAHHTVHGTSCIWAALLCTEHNHLLHLALLFPKKHKSQRFRGESSYSFWVQRTKGRSIPCLSRSAIPRLQVQSIERSGHCLKMTCYKHLN